MSDHEEIIKYFPTMKAQGAAKNEAHNAAQTAGKAAEATAAPAAAETAPVKVDIDFSNVEVEPLFEDMVDFRNIQQIRLPCSQSQRVRSSAEEQEASEVRSR